MRGALLPALGALSLAAGAAAGAAAVDWPTYSYKTGPWEPPQLVVNKTDGYVENELIFIPVRVENTAGTAPTIYDTDGELIYQGPMETTMDMKPATLFGKPVLLFWSGQVSDAGGYGYGSVHILDDTYNEIYTVTLTGDFNSYDTQEKDSYIDVHEHHITSRNTIIVSAINVTQYDLSVAGGPSDGWIIVNQFYEIDIPTNKVLYKWDALEHVDDIPSKTPITPLPATLDGYLVSLRFYWGAYYLEHDTGAVRWFFNGTGGGDFAGNDNSFSWQHDFRIYNETEDSAVLSLFNNGNGQQKHESVTTGMLYELDIANKQATMLQNLTDPANPLNTQTQGSVQMLGAASQSTNVFMGYGSNAFVKEFSGDGDVVLSGQFAPLGQGQSYRAFKSAWSAIPLWNPVAVTEVSGSNTTVYMSWNGATEYDTWAIYSAPSASSNKTTLLTTTPGLVSKLLSILLLTTPLISRLLLARARKTCGRLILFRFDLCPAWTHENRSSTSLGLVCLYLFSRYSTFH
ncbi:ASST-domain-containing protein [Penicillium chermesinum]|uniref:ASST-domain-containing protein n=1 Tax=Penicillium chermesinum TaxID=63820 RepID=A0A9W9P7X0_9EURO|nr:ASST-domain-containing protein [Penicillium chermesinum]KAJ5239186.1 ASST-domain-containing protein [Penicillium chermesinum]